MNAGDQLKKVQNQGNNGKSSRIALTASRAYTPIKIFFSKLLDSAKKKMASMKQDSVDREVGNIDVPSFLKAEERGSFSMTGDGRVAPIKRKKPSPEGIRTDVRMGPDEIRRMVMGITASSLQKTLTRQNEEVAGQFRKFTELVTECLLAVNRNPEIREYSGKGMMGGILLKFVPVLRKGFEAAERNSDDGILLGLFEEAGEICKVIKQKEHISPRSARDVAKSLEMFLSTGESNYPEKGVLPEVPAEVLEHRDEGMPPGQTTH